MKQMVPLEKMSKKQKRKYAISKRGSWYGIRPVTQVVPDGTAYSRSTEKKTLRREMRAYADSI